MKKFHFIIIFLLYSLNTLGQNGEVMQFILPKGTEKLNNPQLKSLIHNGFNEKTALGFHDHIYKKDGLIIYYQNLSQFPTHPERRHSLESNQKMMVALLSGNSELKGDVSVVDNSRIITVNNIRFAIIEYHNKDDRYIRVTSDYDKNGGMINGFIEYKKPDESEARQYLQDILQNMHFRNN
jgi:hypothetical protein